MLAEAEETGCRTEMFLAGLHFPRFVVTSLDHNIADCEVTINTFFIFLEDTDDGILEEFLPGLPRCWIRAHFVVVFPERWRLLETDQRRKHKHFVAWCYTGWRKCHFTVDASSVKWVLRHPV